MMERYLTVGQAEIEKFFGRLPERANKGSMGRVLCVCGSYEERGLSMCGAAYFSAMAAYRSGAGIVEIFTPRKNYEALASRVPEAVFSLYEKEEEEGDVVSRLCESISHADSVVLGCGLGKSMRARSLVRATLEKVNVPLVIDADGLNIIAEDSTLLSLLSSEQRRKTVITPHPGEMMRLCGSDIKDILDDTVGAAKAFSQKHGTVCLMKDHNTVIAGKDGIYINQSGNPGMATAGMGDVLSGIIGALLARSDHSALEAAAVGAYLHGIAGDRAAEKMGQYSLVASDVLSQICEIVAREFGQF